MHRVEFDEKRIDAIFAELDQCHLPGAAVGIAIGGRPVYRKGFGLAHMELPVILSPSMRMRIASITKQFTALAYLLLCEDEKASLDEPIGKHVPELHPANRCVTFRQLMGHTGGLRDAFDVLYSFSGTGARVSTQEILSVYRDLDEPNDPPDRTWRYSSGGYVILTTAIERIADRPLEEVLQERILAPVGMWDTRLRPQDSDFVPNSATLHMTTSGGGFDRSYLGSALAGEGGMVSTVDDMLRWLAQMGTPVVGSPASWQALLSARTLSNGTSTGYGLGIMRGRYRGVETISHPGGVSGGNAQMIKVPSAGLDVVIMVNRQDVLGMELATQILDACLPDIDPVEEAVARPLLTGVFRSPTTGRVIQLFAKHEQQIASIDGFDLPVRVDKAGAMHPAGIFGYMRQSIAADGGAEPASIRFEDFGNPDELLRLRAAPGSPVAAVAGKYRSRSARAEVTISDTEEGPRMHTRGAFGWAEYALESLAEGLWRATSPMPRSGVLSFARDGDGFQFSTGLTRALPFHRVA